MHRALKTTSSWHWMHGQTCNLVSSLFNRIYTDLFSNVFYCCIISFTCLIDSSWFISKCWLYFVLVPTFLYAFTISKKSTILILYQKVLEFQTITRHCFPYWYTKWHRDWMWKMNYEIFFNVWMQIYFFIPQPIIHTPSLPPTVQAPWGDI